MGQAWEEIKADERAKGREEGREETRRLGIYAMIQDNVEEGHDRKTIVGKLRKYFSLEESDAVNYINQYMV